YRPDLKAELRRQLTGLGAGLLLGSPLEAGPPTAAGELGTFTVTTQAGAEVTVDIWFRCYGVTPASDYLAGGLAAARRPDGFVEVTPELRVAGQDQVFALGDVSAADPNKGAGAAGRQAPVVAGNIRALITGAGALRTAGGERHRADRARRRRRAAGGQRGAGVRRDGGRAQGPGHDGGPVRRVARPEYLTDRESVRANGIFQDLVLLAHRARLPVQIEHRGRLGVPGRDHRVTVETAAARIGDVPAQHGVTGIAGVVVAGVDLHPVAVRIAQVDVEGVGHPVPPGAALDVPLGVQRAEDV